MVQATSSCGYTIAQYQWLIIDSTWLDQRLGSSRPHADRAAAALPLQLQAFFLVADDIMDGSITRRGQPCWYKQQKVRSRQRAVAGPWAPLGSSRRLGATSCCLRGRITT